MLGAFNAMNALAAIAAGAALGIDRETLQRGLTDFPGVAGRMEVVTNGDVRVLVDFAHAERSLFAMLSSVRAITTGRVIVVVGCASGRDPSRRAGLGRSAALGADVIILTEDDSHGEAVGPILAEMQRAVLDAGGVPYLEPERAAAIQYAISIAELGDTVVVAGKGHERTLERNGTNVPWDDVEECRRALKIRGVDRPISWVSE